MNNIILVTTEGCAGCDIQKNIIEQAISCSEDKYSINFQYHDVSEVDMIVKQLHITDFPTTILVKNGTYEYHVTGTCTKNQLIHLFNKYFVDDK